MEPQRHLSLHLVRTAGTGSRSAPLPAPLREPSASSNERSRRASGGPSCGVTRFALWVQTMVTIFCFITVHVVQEICPRRQAASAVHTLCRRAC
jgi:hypothetical protein